MREYHWFIWGKDGLETVRFRGVELGGCLVTKKDDLCQNSVHIEVFQAEDGAIYVRKKDFLNEDQITTVYKYADLREATAAACCSVKEAAEAGFSVVIENIYLEHPTL